MRILLVFAFLAGFITHSPLFGAENSIGESARPFQISLTLNKTKKIESYMNEAMACEATGNYGRAIDLYNETMLYLPNKKTRYEVFVRTGKIKLQMKQYASAIEDFKRATDLYPGKEQVRLELAKAYEASDLSEFAEKEYENIIKKNKYSFDAVYNLALLYARDGFYSQAMNMYNKALILKPGNDVYRNIAICARKNSDQKMAVEMLKKIVSSKSGTYEDYVMLGELYEAAGTLTDSENVYLEAKKIDDSKEEIYLKLGMLYINNSRFNEAEKVLKEAVSKFKTSGTIHFFLGVVYNKTGNLILAKEELKTAGKLTDNSLIRDYIAFILRGAVQ